jgi:hypothetical protein
MKTVMFPSTLVLLLILFGCGGEPVTRDELVGQWRIDDKTRVDLPEELRSIDISLQLSADGRFTAGNLPGSILFGLSRDSAQPVSGQGLWSLGKGPGGQHLLLEFREFEPEGLRGTPFALDCIRVRRKDSQPRLYFYTYDIDDGRKVYLLKY